MGRVNDPEGLLQTCGFDYYFKFAQTLTIPLSLLHKGAMKHAIHEADNLNSSALLVATIASPVQGEGDRRMAVVGLLQTGGFDENSEFAQTLTIPQSPAVTAPGEIP